MSTTLSVLQFLREAKCNLNKSAFKFLPVLQGRGGFLFFIREARTASCGELQLLQFVCHVSFILTWHGHGNKEQIAICMEITLHN